MSAEFVYPKHDAYDAYRDLAKTAELEVHDLSAPSPDDGREKMIIYRHVDIPPELAYARDVADLTDKAKKRVLKNAPDPTQWFWHRTGAINTVSHVKQWPGEFRNDGHRVHNSTVASADATPQAGELLGYGVGLLRPSVMVANPYSKTLARFKGDGAHSGEWADSELITSARTHVVEQYPSFIDGQWRGDWYALESTNMITPEVLGEIEQLYERINDKAFLEAYLHDLLATFTPIEIHDPNDLQNPLAPPSLRNNVNSWRSAHLSHLMVGKWDELPTNVAELRYRINFMVDAIVTDESSKAA